MTNTQKQDVSNSEAQARAQLASIIELVGNLQAAHDGDDDSAIDEAERAIYDDALSVEARGGWHSIGDCGGDEEYRICLCTGGPAVQIIGELDENAEPATAHLQHQDWFTPWTNLNINEEERQALLDYARCFNYGE